MELISLCKLLLRVSVGLIVAILLVVYPLLYLFQDKLIFIQTRLDEDDLQGVRSKYPDAEVLMTTPDNVKLHGWYVDKGNLKKAPLIIYFGGNAEEVSGLLYDTERFDGWSVLFMNYRGYGLSEGRPSEDYLFKDALFLYDEFSKREDIDNEKIVAMGRSLGTGVAVYLASQRPLKGLILVSPYDSIKNVAKEVYPFVPVSLLLKHHFDSITLAPSIKIPVLALIASEDRVISPSRSKKLLAGWGGPIYEEVVPGADHNTITMGHRYWESITEFLHRLHPKTAVNRGRR
jgi:pimeloyl-ACP methyl ester carboxylesterase